MNYEEQDEGTENSSILWLLMAVVVIVVGMTTRGDLDWLGSAIGIIA